MVTAPRMVAMDLAQLALRVTLSLLLDLSFVEINVQSPRSLRATGLDLYPKLPAKLLPLTVHVRQVFWNLARCHPQTQIRWTFPQDCHPLKLKQLQPFRHEPVHVPRDLSKQHHHPLSS